MSKQSVKTRQSSARPDWRWLLLLVLAVVFIVYYPGLAGPYILDDGQNLLVNEAIAVHDLSARALYDAATSAGEPLWRPLANITFALNYYLSGGFEPSLPFKLTNVFIHLLNTVLVFLLMRALSSTPALTSLPKIYRDRFALTATAVWALHPLQLTSVLYVVQRMNSLAASFMLAGLLLYLQGRMRLSGDRRRGFVTMAGGVVLGLAGISAKENAVLTPLLALVMEYTLFRTDKISARTRNDVRWFQIITVGAPLIAISAYLLLHPQLVTAAYATRDFTLVERLLTEARVLWDYIYLLAIPDIRTLGLFHDDVIVSRGLFTPVSTVFAVTALAALVGFVLVKCKRYPVLAFAVLWFMAAHVLESSVIGLELAYEHRNYVASLGPIAAICFGLTRLASSSRTAGGRLWMLAALIPLVLAVATWRLASIWGDLDTLAEYAVVHHPKSIRAVELAASVNSANGNYANAMRYLKNGQRIAPNDVGFFIDTELLVARVFTELNERIARNPRDRLEIARNYHERLAGEIGVIVRGDTVRLQLPSNFRERIPSLLATLPLKASGMVAMEDLFGCLTEPPRPCRATNKAAAEWFAIAGDNAAILPAYRAELLAYSARLHELDGDTRLALTQVRRAIAIDETRTYYRLLLADLLLRAGETAEAIAVLDNIGDGRQLEPGGKYHAHFTRLRDLATRRDNPR